MSLKNQIKSFNLNKKEDSFDIDIGLFEHEENESEIKPIDALPDNLIENEEEPNLENTSCFQIICSHKVKNKKKRIRSSIKFLRRKKTSKH